MRVYLPLSWPGLREVWAAGEVPVGGGHAVTSALHEVLPGEDEESLEYVALLAAADESAAAAGTPQVRRVVLAVDADAAPDPDRGESAVQLTAAVPLRQVAAVHLDPEPVAADTEDDPGWYAVSEIAGILADVGE